MQQTRLWLPVLAMLILLLTACGAGAESDAAGDDLNVTLIPSAPGMQGETLTIELTDAQGNPVTDAQVALEGNMNHAGMVPVFADAVTDEADGSADGRYEIPFAFTMLGDWIITVEITQAGGATVERDLDVRVSEGSVSGEQVAGSPAGDGEANDAAGNDAEGNTAMEGEHEMAGDQDAAIQVHDPKVREAPTAGGNAAVYLTLHNGAGSRVRLSGGETAAARAVEIHETVNDGGVIRMQPLEDGLPLEPDESATLEAGGRHIMLVDLVEPLAEGDRVALTLTFADGQSLELDIPVVSVDETMPQMEDEE